MPDALKDAIEENAQAPKRAQGDAGSMEQHPLRDQIEADRYLEQAKASAKPARGLRFTKMVMPETGS